MERFFHQDLSKIRGMLMDMSTQTLKMVRSSVAAVAGRDLERATEILSEDERVDALEVAIDTESIRYITLRSPVASDVRFLMSAVRLSHDLERCADEACSVAKRVRLLVAQDPTVGFSRLPKVGELAADLLAEAIEAFAAGDADKAARIPAKDKAIDELNREIFALYADRLDRGEIRSQEATHLMFASKSYERIGDHAANIAEEVVYLLTAEDIRHTEAVKHGPDTPQS